MIFRKLIILSSVAVLTYVSANFNFVNLQAALTPPASYDYSYRSRTVSGNTLFYTQADEIVWYTRTGASYPYDYSSIGTYGPAGMDITMTFNKSNILWTEGTGLFAGKYRPHTSYSYIGSDSTVGTVSSKNYLKFDNQTNKDYILYLDFSSTSDNNYYTTLINDITLRLHSTAIIISTSTLLNLYIPAYSYLSFQTSSTSGARYFDAWYLKDLGVSASYDAGYNDGYDEGEVDGYELGYDDGNEDGLGAVPIENLFTAIFAGVSQIFNINIFGAISLGTIIIAPIAIALLWYILGIVSGVGGKK
jgi:hypothetical protein